MGYLKRFHSVYDEILMGEILLPKIAKRVSENPYQSLDICNTIVYNDSMNKLKEAKINKSETIILRITPEMYQWLENQAGALGVKLSEVVRIIIQNYMTKEI